MLQATIDPRSITPHPSNPRRDVGDVTDLAESIAAVGLLEPLVVAPWPNDLGPEWLCLTPDAHPTDDDDAATPAEDDAPVDEAAAAAERPRAEAQAELELDRAAATELRRAFLAGLLDATTDEQLKRLLVDHLLAAARVEMPNALIRELLSVDQQRHGSRHGR